MILKEKTGIQQWGENLQQKRKWCSIPRVKALLDFVSSFYPVKIEMRLQALELLPVKYTGRGGEPPTVNVNISPRLHISVSLALCLRQPGVLSCQRWQVRVPGEGGVIEKILGSKTISNSLDASHPRHWTPQNFLLERDYVLPRTTSGGGFVLRNMGGPVVLTQTREKPAGAFVYVYHGDRGILRFPRLTHGHIAPVNNVFFFPAARPDRLKQAPANRSQVRIITSAVNPGIGMQQSHQKCKTFGQTLRLALIKACRGDSLWSPVSTLFYPHLHPEMLDYVRVSPTAADSRLAQVSFNRNKTHIILPAATAKTTSRVFKKTTRLGRFLTGFNPKQCRETHPVIQVHRHVIFIDKKLCGVSGISTGGFSKEPPGTALELVTKKIKKIETGIDVEKMEKNVLQNLSRNLDQTINQRLEKRLAPDSKDTLQLTENIYSRLLNRIVLEKERLVF